jgi:hypothetical protein
MSARASLSSRWQPIVSARRSDHGSGLDREAVVGSRCLLTLDGALEVVCRVAHDDDEVILLSLQDGGL